MGKRIGYLGLVNYREHPGNSQYTVFNFTDPKAAAIFENYLLEKRIGFEKDEETENDQFLYAVKNSDFEKAQRGNFKATGSTRKPLIPNSFLRYALLVFVFGIITLGIIGYVKNSGN